MDPVSLGTAALQYAYDWFQGRLADWHTEQKRAELARKVMLHIRLVMTLLSMVPNASVDSSGAGLAVEVPGFTPTTEKDDRSDDAKKKELQTISKPLAQPARGTDPLQCSLTGLKALKHEVENLVEDIRKAMAVSSLDPPNFCVYLWCCGRQTTVKPEDGSHPLSVPEIEDKVSQLDRLAMMISQAVSVASYSVQLAQYHDVTTALHNEEYRRLWKTSVGITKGRCPIHQISGSFFLLYLTDDLDKQRQSVQSSLNKASDPMVMLQRLLALQWDRCQSDGEVGLTELTSYPNLAKGCAWLANQIVAVERIFHESIKFEVLRKRPREVPLGENDDIFEINPATEDVIQVRPFEILCVRVSFLRIGAFKSDLMTVINLDEDKCVYHFDLDDDTWTSEEQPNDARLQVVSDLVQEGKRLDKDSYSCRFVFFEKPGRYALRLGVSQEMYDPDKPWVVSYLGSSQIIQVMDQSAMVMGVDHSEDDSKRNCLSYEQYGKGWVPSAANLYAGQAGDSVGVFYYIKSSLKANTNIAFSKVKAFKKRAPGEPLRASSASRASGKGKRPAAKNKPKSHPAGRLPPCPTCSKPLSWRVPPWEASYCVICGTTFSEGQETACCLPCLSDICSNCAPKEPKKFFVRDDGDVTSGSAFYTTTLKDGGYYSFKFVCRDSGPPYNDKTQKQLFMGALAADMGVSVDSIAPKGSVARKLYLPRCWARLAEDEDEEEEEED